MSKKIFSLLFMIFFFSNLTSAAAGIEIFADMKINMPVETKIIHNNIHFVKDYSKVITEVCKKFVSNFNYLLSLFKNGKNSLVSQNIFSSAYFTESIFFVNIAAKKNYIRSIFAFFLQKESNVLFYALFFTFVLTFILRYIGLLRLFSEPLFFAKQIKN
jgi:hypothetical protein